MQPSPQQQLVGSGARLGHNATSAQSHSLLKLMTAFLPGTALMVRMPGGRFAPPASAGFGALGSQAARTACVLAFALSNWRFGISASP